ncbi:MAG: hypothetical protein U1F87_18130 [Kiritimatiellia bacterium]
MPPPRTLPLISWAAPRWTWSSVVAAGMVTAAIFAGLPFLEQLSHPPERTPFRCGRSDPRPRPPARPAAPAVRAPPRTRAPPRAPPGPGASSRPSPSRAAAPRPDAGAPDLRGDFTGDFALSRRTSRPARGPRV